MHSTWSGGDGNGSEVIVCAPTLSGMTGWRICGGGGTILRGRGREQTEQEGEGGGVGAGSGSDNIRRVGQARGKAGQRDRETRRRCWVKWLCTEWPNMQRQHKRNQLRRGQSER